MEPISIGPLAVWSHEAKDAAFARVLLIHGLGEHSGRHKNTIDFLTQNGIHVVRFDLRGAGRSGGRRQWVDRFEDYVEDVLSVLNWIHRSQSSLPLFLLGQSLGGSIALFFAALHGSAIRGLILSAPGYLAGEAISSTKIALARLLNRVMPQVKIPGSLDLSHLSRNPSVAKDYLTDPLSCHFNTVRQGNEILDALPKLPKVARDIRLPVLIVHGSHDRLVKPEGSFELIQALSSEDKWLHLFPGAYHEPHNDFCKDEFFELILRWLQKRYQ